MCAFLQNPVPVIFSNEISRGIGSGQPREVICNEVRCSGRQSCRDRRTMRPNGRRPSERAIVIRPTELRSKVGVTTLMLTVHG